MLVMTAVLPRPTALPQSRQRTGEPHPGRWKEVPRVDADLHLGDESPFRRRYDTVHDKVAALVNELDTHVAELGTTAGWDDFVDTTARMPRFSANNIRLLRMQLPDVTDVADFKRWRELGRSPKPGAVGLSILVPAKTKIPLTDPDGTPLTDPKGQQMFDERATGETTVATVFDVSQTDGTQYTSSASIPGRAAFAAAFGPVTDVTLDEPEEVIYDVARMRLDVLGGDDTNIDVETHAVSVVIARRWGIAEPAPPAWADRSDAAVRASSVRVSRVVSRLLGTPVLP